MKIAFDTNLLVYAEGVNGALKQQQAGDLIAGLPAMSVVVPTQVLGELFSVLVNKARWSRKKTLAAILAWQDAYEVADTSASVLTAALNLAVDHGLAIWDSVVVSAAAMARCRLLLSEDMQDGFTWQGVTVVNPFARIRHPILQGLLADTR